MHRVRAVRPQRQHVSGEVRVTKLVIQYVGAHVIVEVPAVFGNAASVAARCRAEGLAARKVGNEVHVNGEAEKK